MWAERKTERGGPKTDLSGASGERGSKNQVERERSGSRRSPERTRNYERANYAAQIPLHHKTTQIKAQNRF